MKQCKHAFTLIELLVVICIIAILASMLLPALQSARESASTATCVSNLGQMSKAFQMYATSFNDFMPALTASQSGGSCGWEYALIDALGQDRNNSPFRKSFFCDADSSSDNPSNNKKSYSLNNLKEVIHPKIALTLNANGGESTGTADGYISGNIPPPSTPLPPSSSSAKTFPKATPSATPPSPAPASTAPVPPARSISRSPSTSA